MSSFKLICLIPILLSITSILSAESQQRFGLNAVRNKRHDSNPNPFAYKSPIVTSNGENPGENGSPLQIGRRSSSIMGPGPKYFKSKQIEELRLNFNHKSFKPESNSPKKHMEETPSRFTGVPDYANSARSSMDNGYSPISDSRFSEALKTENAFSNKRPYNDDSRMAYQSKFLMGAINESPKGLEERHGGYQTGRFNNRFSLGNGNSGMNRHSATGRNNMFQLRNVHKKLGSMRH